MTDWDRRYFDLAGHVAAWSKDPRTKVGAVIVGADRREIAFGYNGFPPGLADTDDRLQVRSVKHIYVQHAERNALDNAKFDCRGATMAVTLYPCHDCAKSMITRGIVRVICPPPPTEEPWQSSASWARRMLEEVGVEVVEVARRELDAPRQRLRRLE